MVYFVDSCRCCNCLPLFFLFCSPFTTQSFPALILSFCQLPFLFCYLLQLLVNASWRHTNSWRATFDIYVRNGKEKVRERACVCGGRHSKCAERRRRGGGGEGGRESWIMHEGRTRQSLPRLSATNHVSHKAINYVPWRRVIVKEVVWLSFIF